MELALRTASSILTIVIASVIASPSFAQGMMQSSVLVVPSFAEAPKEVLAQVYVITNGIKGVARPH